MQDFYFFNFLSNDCIKSKKVQLVFFIMCCLQNRMSVPDYIRGGFTGNNSVTPNYPLSHLTPSFDDFAVEIAAKGNKSSPIHFLF